MLAIRVGKSVFFHFNRDLADVYIKIGLSACILIGPALYFYIKSVMYPEKKNKYWPVHFLILLISAILVSYLFPETFNPKLGFISWISVIYYVWLFYIIASGYILRNVIKKIFLKNDRLNGLDFWLLSVFTGNFIIWVAYKTVAYTSYIVGALSFSFIFYLMFLLIHFNKKKEAIFSKSVKYSDKKIDEVEANALIAQLKHLMHEDRLYIDANLKLPDVAKEMNVLPHKLSQVLNDNLKKSFTNFINEYRIKEAKELIKTDDKLTLEAIGYECGFNSKSTFYSAFKKYSGKTPSQFKSTL